MSKITVENWPNWFRQMWPEAQRRWLALQGYRSLQMHPSTLADIALRNNVFAPIREGTPHMAAIAEGRRQCALDIIKLANMDAATLFEQTQIDRKKTGEGK